MTFNKSNVIVSGSRSSLSEYANYTTVYPKPAMVGGKIVLTQDMINKQNVKYIIKWNFDLDDETITVPEGCLIEFDGGSFSNGTLVGNETILVYNQEEEDVFKNVSLEGSFERSTSAIADKMDNTNGMAKIYLKKNKPLATQLTQPNTIYVIQYDFTLDEDITIPENCILEFDGGAISNGTITGQNTVINAELVKIFNTDVTLEGSWNVAEAYPEWFGAKGNGENEDSYAIQSAVKYFPKIVFKGLYLISKSIRVNSDKKLVGIDGAKFKSNVPLEHLTILNGSENIEISNLILEGTAEGYPNMAEDTGARAAYLIKVNDNCSNIGIFGCSMSNATGGIFILEGSKNIVIKRNKFSDFITIMNHQVNPTNAAGGYGVVLHKTFYDGSYPTFDTCTENVIVSENVFENIQRHSFYPQIAKYVCFENNTIKNCHTQRILGAECAISDGGIYHFVIKGNTMYSGSQFYASWNYGNVDVNPEIGTTIIDVQDVIIESNNLYNLVNTNGDESYPIRVHQGIKNISIISNYIQTVDIKNIIRFNAPSDNIVISKNYIEHNSISQRTLYGISLSEGSLVADYSNVLIEDNIIKTEATLGFGVHLVHGHNYNNITINNNVINGYARGIDCGDNNENKNIVICGNILKNQDSSSIRLYDTTKTSNVVITGNISSIAPWNTTNEEYKIIVADNIGPNGILNSATLNSNGKLTSTQVPVDNEDVRMENNTIKFNNKGHDPSTYSGLGRNYLRKRMVNDVNTLQQGMINASYAIHIIQYDFNIPTGETITLKPNCILKFEGGSIKGGTLVLDHTKIEPNGCILSNYITSTITGSFATGQCLFENGKPKYWNGTAWVDATGTPV